MSSSVVQSPPASPWAWIGRTLRSHPTAWGAAATLLVFAAVSAASPNFRPDFDASLGPFGGDFIQEWIGGYVVRTGQGARLYDAPFVRQLQHDPKLTGFAWNPDRYLPMVYPPFYYAAVSPLSLIPLPAAALAWAAMMLLCLVATQVLLSRSISGPARCLAWLWPCAVFFAPLVEDVNANQKATLLLLLFSSTYVLLRRGRPFAAGAVFGLLAFKPQLAILIGAAMLWKRQWRFVAGGAATAFGLLLVSLAMGGEVCRDYLAFSARTADYLRTPGYDLSRAHCWYGFFHLALGGASDGAIRIAAAIAVVATLGTVVWLMRGPVRPGSGRFAAQYSGLVLASVLVSPHLLTYDLTVLLLPAVLLGVELRGVLQSHEAGTAAGPTARQLVAVALGLLLACNVSTSLAGAIGLQLSVAAMSGVLVWLALVQRRLGSMERAAGLC